MNSVPEKDNPLAQWAALVSGRADRVFKSKPADNLASAVGVSLVTAKSWLEGSALPDADDRHTQLMTALRLPHRVEDITPTMTDMQVKLAQLRDEMEELYPEALAWHREHPVAPAAAPAARQSSLSRAGGGGATTQAQRGAFRDHDAIRHLRKHTGGTPYEDLGEAQLKQYLSTTENAHEYLRCYRILKGVSHTVLKNLIAGYNPIEAGRDRLSPAMLERMREHVFNNATAIEDKAAYNRFVDLVIQNRQRIIHHYLACGHHHNAMNEMSHMPPVYWREALARYLQPQAWDARQDKPGWAVQEIKTRGEYLRAIRGALSLS